MRVPPKFIVCLVLVVSVVAVFVAPAVDLEPTAMRAARAAQLFMCSFAAAAAIMFSLLPAMQSAHVGLFGHLHVLCSSADILDVDCARLC